MLKSGEREQATSAINHQLSIEEGNSETSRQPQASPHLTAQGVLQLQARHGNAFVRRMLRQSSPVVQRVRNKDGTPYPVAWGSLDYDSAGALLSKIQSKELLPDDGDVARLMAILTKPRPRRSATEDVSYKGQMQSSSGFNPRHAHAKTTSYPDNPVTLTANALQSDPPMLQIYHRMHRPSMSDKFTQELVDEAEKKPTMNPFEQRISDGQSLSDAEVSRNHRLADSSIHAIIATCFQTLANQPTGKRNATQLKAFQDWTQIMGNGAAYQDMLNALAAHDSNMPAVGHLQNAYTKLSVNTTNVRLADSEFNERISNAADWGMTPSGGLTPISALIKPATLHLATVGLIPNDLAVAATSQAVDKATGQVMSSTRPF
jgi:hypothetical protein